VIPGDRRIESRVVNNREHRSASILEFPSSSTTRGPSIGAAASDARRGYHAGRPKIAGTTEGYPIGFAEAMTKSVFRLLLTGKVQKDRVFAVSNWREWWPQATNRNNPSEEALIRAF
jgi:hypothetical protein